MGGPFSYSSPRLSEAFSDHPFTAILLPKVESDKPVRRP